MSLPAPRAAAASAQARSPRNSVIASSCSALEGRINSRKPRERRRGEAASVSTPRATSSSSSASSTSSSSSASSPLLAPNAARLTTLSDCGLRISVYPPFSYDASGGGAPVGTVGEEENDGEGKKSPLSFDPSAVSIPALDFRTTRFLGLPLPPGLRIEIEPLKLSGWVRRATGEVSLDFEANFSFSALGGLYRPPPLFVSTTLTTGEARSGKGGGGSVGLSGRGEALGADGSVALSGVAVVEPVGDFILDSFLMLPTECLAELRAELELG